MKTLFSLPLSIGAGFVASIVLVAFTVYAWTGPTSAPPNGNVAAPVNVSINSQVKLGGLWATSMGTDSGYCIGSSCITSWAGMVGPQGPVGATGATGATGPQGPAGSGTPGIAVYYCPATGSGNCSSGTCGGLSSDPTCTYYQSQMTGSGDNETLSCIQTTQYCTYVGHLIP